MNLIALITVKAIPACGMKMSAWSVNRFVQKGHDSEEQGS
jgi:hypothetical protein